MMLEKKNPIISYLKGILILFVIIGHCSRAYPNGIIQTIYWFHMPAFFMVSGYLYTNRKLLITYIGSKFKRLIVPYCIWFILISILLNKLNKDDMISFVFATKRISGVFWFPPCLLIVCILFALLHAKIKKQHLIVVVIVFYVISIIESKFLQTGMISKNFIYNIPFYLDVSMLAFVYYAIGYEGRIICEKLQMPGNTWKKFLLFALLIIIIISNLILYKTGIHKFNMHMKIVMYQDFVCSILLPICFTLFLFILIQYIEPIPIIKPVLKLLEYIGDNSIVFMYLHYFLLKDIFEAAFCCEKFQWLINAGMTVILCIVASVIINKSYFLKKILCGRF